MGSQLILYYPTFARTIRKLDQILGELEEAPEWTIEDSLLEDAQTSRVSEAEFAQPLCTAIQIAIVELLQSWGISPAVTVGHSSGEIAAAFAAGMLSATEAIIAAYFRGKVTQEIPTDGSMLAVGLGAETVQPYLKEFNDRLIIACHNSPASVTISGNTDAIVELEAKLDRAGVFARLVKTGGKAYHSKHMEAVSSRHEELLGKAYGSIISETRRPSGASMISSVTLSKMSTSDEITPQYWSQNLVSPVLFN